MHGTADLEQKRLRDRLEVSDKKTGLMLWTRWRRQKKVKA